MSPPTSKSTIESLCLKVTSGATPSRQVDEYWANGTIPWVKSGELKDNHIYGSTEHITETAISESSARTFPENTVLMAMYGDGKTITSLGIVKSEAAANQACCAMIVDPKKCHYRFLFYSLMLRRREFLPLVVAGAQRNLSVGIIKKFEIDIPPVPAQHRIVSILAAYDDLIENNRRRIQLLHEAARLLYKEWFVHLRFPGHEHVEIVDGVPRGWTRVPFSEVASFVNGFAFKPSHHSAEGLPIVKIPELRNGPTAGTPRNSGIMIPAKYRISTGDILFSWSGTLLVELWTYGPALLNQHLFRVIPKRSRLRSLIYLGLREALESFHAETTGATLKHIRRSALERVSLLVPDKKISQHFETSTREMLEQTQILSAQSERAAKARDILLPRLMNGDITV